MTERNPYGNGPTGKGESIAWVVFSGIIVFVLLVLTIIEWISLFGFLVLMAIPTLGGFIGLTGIAVYSDNEEAVETSREMK